MTKYSLANASTSRKIAKGQAEAVYRYLQPHPSQHTLDELVRKAELDGYESLFNGKGSPTIRESLTYHLGRFATNGIVNVTNV